MRRAFTLVELMVGAVVLVGTLLGLLGAFVACLRLNETSRNLTIAINGAQQKLEELRNLCAIGTPRAAGHYSETLSNFPATHRVAIDILNDGSDPQGLSDADLCWVSISVSWEEKGPRIIGEDNGEGAGVALNGIVDGTEDVNDNGMLDSPAQIISLMRR